MTVLPRPRGSLSRNCDRLFHLLHHSSVNLHLGRRGRDRFAKLFRENRSRGRSVTGKQLSPHVFATW